MMKAPNNNKKTNAHPEIEPIPEVSQLLKVFR